eukprot:1147372-Pelagomonas_calceolata.AAC.3
MGCPLFTLHSFNSAEASPVEPADPAESLYSHPRVLALPHLGSVSQIFFRKWNGCEKLWPQRSTSTGECLEKCSMSRGEEVTGPGLASNITSVPGKERKKSM